MEFWGVLDLIVRNIWIYAMCIQIEFLYLSWIAPIKAGIRFSLD
jgi:hypothetical protein